MVTSKEVRELTIDPEFEKLGRKLTFAEENYLYASLEQEGCRDAIIVWANHDDTILDGHNRYRLCRENNIKFKVVAIDLPDRHACKDWIIKNALGRRNLSEEEQSYIRGKIYNHNKRFPEAPPGSSKRVHSEQAHHSEGAKERIAKEVGKEFDVSASTIQRDGEFAEALDTIAENVGEKVKDEIISGESGLHKKQLKAISELPADEQAEAIEDAKVANRNKKTKANPFDLSDRCARVIERIEGVVEDVDRIAKANGGHVNHSREVNRALKDCITKVQAMEKFFKGRTQGSSKKKVARRPKPTRA